MTVAHATSPHDTKVVWWGVSVQTSLHSESMSLRRKKRETFWVPFQKDGSVIIWLCCDGLEARLKHEDRRLWGRGADCSADISQEAGTWRRDLDQYMPFIDTPPMTCFLPLNPISGNTTKLWFHTWISARFESKPPWSPPNIAVFVTWALWRTLPLQNRMPSWRNGLNTVTNYVTVWAAHCRHILNIRTRLQKSLYQTIHWLPPEKGAKFKVEETGSL